MKDKLLQRFVGTIDGRDEYQRQEIHKELAFSGVLLWTLTMLLMAASFIDDTIHEQFSFITVSLLIINMVYAFYVVARLRKKQLDDTDCASEEEYKARKKQLKKSSIVGGMSWGVIMLFMMQYLFPYLSTGKIDVSWQNIMIWVIAGVFFGMGIYYFAKSKLKKHY